MESCDYYSDEDEEFNQRETVAESCNEKNLLETKYEKWLDSNTHISNISSIYRLELEEEKKQEIIKENKNETKIDINENKQKDKYEKENYEENTSKEGIIEETCEDSFSEESFQDSNNISAYYTFIWKEGGNVVKLTGSFSDWKIQYQMTKDPSDNLFKLKLPLNNDIYQYKFIVDGNWKFSKYDPTKDDGNGNINNILDNTKNVLVKPKENKLDSKKAKNKEKYKKAKIVIKKAKTAKRKKKYKERGMSTKTETTKTRASTINKEKFIRNISIYQSQYPSDDDILPLPLPNERYFKYFELENYSNQKFIGNNKYYNYYDKYCFSFEASSRPIFVLGHVNLNHLISVKQKSNSKFVKNSMSLRYREKETTFIYYK